MIMREDQDKKARSGGSKPLSATQEREPRKRQPAQETFNDALADLQRFLQGQEHQPDAALQMDAIVQNINMLMDDELIEGLDHVERHFVYSNEVADMEVLLKGYCLRELIDKLRNVQKARLRDALNNLLRQRPN